MSISIMSWRCTKDDKGPISLRRLKGVARIKKRLGALIMYDFVSICW